MDTTHSLIGNICRVAHPKLSLDSFGHSIPHGRVSRSTSCNLGGHSDCSDSIDDAFGSASWINGQLTVGALLIALLEVEGITIRSEHFVTQHSFGKAVSNISSSNDFDGNNSFCAGGGQMTSQLGR